MNKRLDNDNDANRPDFCDPTSRSAPRLGTVPSDLDHDELILSLLTGTVKAMTGDQVAQFVTAKLKSPIDSAGRIVRMLRRQGWVETTKTAIPFFPWDDKPLFVACKDEATTISFASLAWQLQKREKNRFPKRVQVIQPTQKACNKFGGRVASIKANQLVHDLHVTQVALANQHRGNWIREDYLGLYGFDDGLLPDGLIIKPENESNIVVEIGSATYDKTRLQALAEAFTNDCTQFELW